MGTENNTQLNIKLKSGVTYHVAPGDWHKVSYGEDFIRIYRRDKVLLLVLVTPNVEYIEYVQE